MRSSNLMVLPLLAVLCASLVSCIAGADGANDVIDEPVADAPMALKDTNPVAREEATSNAAADDGTGNVSADPAESDVTAPPVSAEACHCYVQCRKPDGTLGNIYDRGIHNDCMGTAIAFCWDKWGYDAAGAWCS